MENFNPLDSYLRPEKMDDYFATLAFNDLIILKYR
jgi:hypothetical protein